MIIKCNCTRCTNLNNTIKQHNIIFNRILNCYTIKFNSTTNTLTTTLKEDAHNDINDLKKDLILTEYIIKKLSKTKCYN